MVKAILFMLFLVGCGQSPVKMAPNDPYFDQYHQDFDRTFNLDTTYIPISWEAMDDQTIAFCSYRGTDYRQIKFNVNYKDVYNSDQIEQIVWHELSHCAALRTDHIDGTVSLNGYVCPISIMGTYAFNTWLIDCCYLPNKSYYTHELATYMGL